MKSITPRTNKLTERPWFREVNKKVAIKTHFVRKGDLNVACRVRVWKKIILSK